MVRVTTPDEKSDPSAANRSVRHKISIRRRCLNFMWSNYVMISWIQNQFTFENSISSCKQDQLTLSNNEYVSLWANIEHRRVQFTLQCDCLLPSTDQKLRKQFWISQFINVTLWLTYPFTMRHLVTLLLPHYQECDIFYIQVAICC